MKIINLKESWIANSVELVGLLYVKQMKSGKDFLKKCLKHSGMGNMKLSKMPQNGGLPQDFFRRAKRAGKTLVLGFQEKTYSCCFATSKSASSLPSEQCLSGRGCIDAD